jgi:DNA-binding MarR family transcriptional regulator
MSEWPEHVRLRVVTDEVKLSDIRMPVPKGEYDGYVDWRNGPDGERHVTAVQLMIDREALAQMGRSEAIPSMQCEVLQYLKRGDIEPV